MTEDTIDVAALCRWLRIAHHRYITGKIVLFSTQDGNFKPFDPLTDANDDLLVRSAAIEKLGAAFTLEYPCDVWVYETGFFLRAAWAVYTERR